MKNLQGHRLKWMKWRQETTQLGLLINPKSDSSVSKVVHQLPCRIEALQWSKIILKQPLRKVGAQVVNIHPPIVNEDEDYLWVQKMTQCQVKTKVFLIKPKDLDYLQKFVLRVVAT
jgi:hypothetical protein